MTDWEFGYQALLKSDESGTITSIIAYQAPIDGPPQAVRWSNRRKAWIYGPGLVVRFLYDDQFQDRIQPIDRPTGERIAKDVFGTELPTEPALQEMIDEGQRMGWMFGPPRQ